MVTKCLVLPYLAAWIHWVFPAENVCTDHESAARQKCFGVAINLS